MTCKIEMHNNQCKKKKKEGSSVNYLALLVVTFSGKQFSIPSGLENAHNL